MKIEKETLQKIAHLARLEVKPEEEVALLASMESVLSWMEQLNELDTTNVKPLTHIAPETNVLRDDAPKSQLARHQALRNSPVKDDTFFRVPKVME
ncbi:MAG: Asp-tRNA(Asn)/Glu-tRNA(Gln) amidotransferase subunit GatC [Runella slithyformis]|nr:MAG: Asp-tRNA(Asn)/Glu-tRNA(Gln) amidotransferase subunit GatC [Runella slithyformis]TAF95439.1 MAG: Asp-tRNA(Asn)/Glu-tRNA(Gln) amidotransferase subunit GatC [Runella sp.]TAG17321.1 MAG: Asp-tRNA(Asn)/Glu-tRNA(Gln) amidotransferase subunit GatC [Cytophagales bacterium]TAG40244.1 MAG: Asp-tRNA(Asn)/Glu-tRNA(Gln) amidotransferase subunit GatC [Cytophagia bacterium]TAF28806.1 MAG: Asp-tRNA(Asn)/Glu-tRNA(Gln) amidotransferase subunit GatC [Runella slithyformis]